MTAAWSHCGQPEPCQPTDRGPTTGCACKAEVAAEYGAEKAPTFVVAVRVTGPAPATATVRASGAVWAGRSLTAHGREVAAESDAGVGVDPSATAGITGRNGTIQRGDA